MASSIPSAYNAAIACKRKQRDIAKLLMSDYKVTQSKQNKNDMLIEFPGPVDSLYQGGIWTVHVLLPDHYPYKSPSIGFLNRIFHPNVDEASGSVCLDVINQTWSPMYDLLNIFDTFLPQLLSYPNPHDPLNPEAAALMNKDIKRYETRVRDYVQSYAVQGGAKEISSQNETTHLITENIDLEVKLGEIRDLSLSNSNSNTSTPPSTATTRRDSQEMDEEITSPNAKPLRLDSNDREDQLFDEEEVLSEASVISTESLSQLSDLDEADLKDIENYC